MDDGIRRWFEKIEQKLDSTNEKVIQMQTQLMMYLPKHDELENRVDAVEDDMTEMKSENKIKHRNNLIWVGLSASIAVVAGILIDHYLIK